CHFSHHYLMDALGSDSMLAAVNTSLTPCAITSRAGSTRSLPLRAFSAALCHARQISSACFLSRVFVERNTRLLVRVSGFQIVVIGSEDTGVRWTHDALKPHYRGWDGQNATT